MSVASAIATVLAAAGLGVAGGVVHAATDAIIVSIQNMSGPGFSAEDIRFELSGRTLSAATLRVRRVEMLEQVWRDVHIECTRFKLSKALLACTDGRLVAPTQMALAFEFNFRSGNAALQLVPGHGERFEAALIREGTQSRIHAVFSNLDVARLGALFDALPVTLQKGSVDGSIGIRFDEHRHIDAWLDVRAQSVVFSDERGLRAGEGIGFALTARAAGQADDLNWRADIAWTAGEAFWNPVYAKAGHRLTATGSLRPGEMEIATATLIIAGVGEMQADGRLLRNPWRIDHARVRSTGAVNLAAAYASYVKPFLAGTALGDLRAEGNVSFRLDWDSGRLQSVHAEADNVSLEDNQRRFAVFGAYAVIPWRRDGETDGRIGLSGAELQRIPIGAVGANVRILQDGVRAPEVRIPVLSGMLTLRDLSLRKLRDDWVLSVGAELSPVPLDALLAYFGLPAMRGSISGRLPQLRYERSTLAVDGALEIEVFGGAVKLSNLTVTGPLGLAPRLQTDVQARRLDLELITRTFSFGHMTGYIDIDIRELEMSRWVPVKFDARIASSPGRYRKRISQTAVSNISALGGAGAAAAIQRSFLRFFESFGYSRLGITCRLAQGVCRMGGIQDVPQGYIIVQGGGIPAINVFGYNRQVGWDELLARLRRVIDSNVRPTVR